MIPLDTMMVVTCCLALAYGAAHDIATRTIPDTLCVCIGLVGIMRAAATHHLAWSFVIAAAIFLLGVCAWRASVLGGGDVKLLTAVSFSLDPDWEPALLATTAIAGGILACLYILLGFIVPAQLGPKPRSFARRVLRAELHRLRRRGPLPYAVAIATGAIVCLVKQ